MLSFKATYKDGSVHPLAGVISARLSMDIDVPADSLTLSLPYSRALRDNAASVAAFDGESQVFFGRIDELSSVIGGSGRLCTLSARSLAGLLLDNEAEPVEYRNPSAALIYARHLKPFGIVSYDEERHPMYGALRISKGMSHWQVVETYCLNRYGCPPRIEGSRAYLRDFGADRRAVFGEGGIRYVSIEERSVPCRLIGKVRLKLSRTGGYESTMDNPNPACLSVGATRFVNAAADNSSPETARRMLEKSNRASYEIRLKAAGAICGILGAVSEVRDPLLGTIGGLRVSALSCTLSRGFCQTAVKLRKENF